MAAPEAVSPVVAYLAHPDCAVNGEIYSVAGGRVALVFLAETTGVVLRELTAESVRDHLVAIADEAGYHQPRSLEAAATILADALTP